MPPTPQFSVVSWLLCPLSQTESRSYARTSTGRQPAFGTLLSRSSQTPARSRASGGCSGVSKQLPSFKWIPPMTALKAQLTRNGSRNLVWILVELPCNAREYFASSGHSSPPVKRGISIGCLIATVKHQVKLGKP